VANDYFEADINPAFSERCSLKFDRIKNKPQLTMLIRNNFRADEKEDTFYYKSIIINDTNISFFDSLLNNWPKQWKPRAITVLDGIHMNYTKFMGRDTFKLELHGPSLWADSFGYRLTTSLFNKFELCFQDSLISDYLLELRSYIENDSILSTAPRLKLFEQRAMKYGWKYRR